MSDESNNDERNYDVGYGKPPVASRFKPGKSGNPRGRPKGSRGVRTILNEELNRTIAISEAGKASVVSKGEAITRALVNKAIKGDVRAFSQIVQLAQEQEGGRSEKGGVVVNVIDQFDDTQ